MQWGCWCCSCWRRWACGRWPHGCPPGGTGWPPLAGTGSTCRYAGTMSSPRTPTGRRRRSYIYYSVTCRHFHPKRSYSRGGCRIRAAMSKGGGGGRDRNTPRTEEGGEFKKRCRIQRRRCQNMFRRVPAQIKPCIHSNTRLSWPFF